MNKLIIAGNGFDLAHGLPTSYENFMDAFWRDLAGNYKDAFFHKIIAIDPRFFHEKLLYCEINNYNEFEELISIYTKEIELLNNYDGGKVYEFKNQFFEELNKTQSIQNWVDVENEYYQALKIICKDEKLEVRQKREEVLNLHKEFDQVKQLLERYLQKNVVEVYDFNHELDNRLEIKEILRPFVYNFINVHGKRLFDEFTTPEDQDYILKLHDQYNLNYQNGKITRLNIGRVLNFNYTPIFIPYLKSLVDDYGYGVTKVNYIHGELNKNIIFGFGDEMDDDYKLIEDMDDNEYLRYFKSFQYSQNSRYKSILRYIESEKFQVIIMGHSCGLSDRTLLNTIFEHDNCRSIKVFYHQEEEGKDNYTEIIQNISRHFNDKKLMRTKIVEKTLCEPMPQIELPKKV